MTVSPTAVSKSSHSDDFLIIAGKHYQSRLLVGTGKYKDMQEIMVECTKMMAGTFLLPK